MSTFVFGHKNPDTDSVVSAIVAADLYGKRGFDVTAATQGPIPPETAFILKKFGLNVPQVISEVAGHNAFLVDHSDLPQAPSDIASAHILGIVDHHKLGDITTSHPIEAWIWPVGCSCTVLKNMYDFYGMELSRNLAGAALCAILADTVMFKSPTTTEQDKQAAKALADIAGISDPMALGMEIFKIKSAIDGTSAHDLLFRDFKDFDMNGNTVGIGQLEVVDLSLLDKIREDLLAEIKKLHEQGRHSVLLLLTDIMKEGSELLCSSNDAKIIEKAFNVAITEEPTWLPGVMSRKKQVVPPLEVAFKN